MSQNFDDMICFFQPLKNCICYHDTSTRHVFVYIVYNLFEPHTDMKRSKLGYLVLLSQHFGESRCANAANCMFSTRQPSHILIWTIYFNSDRVQNARSEKGCRSFCRSAMGVNGLWPVCGLGL